MPWKKPIPQSNYYAVIFASSKSDNLEGYAEMDELTLKLAQEQPGFLGYESAGDHSGNFYFLLGKHGCHKRLETKFHPSYG